MMTEPSFMNCILKEAILKGSLRWLLPVRGLLREEERAFEALRMWMPEEVRPASVAGSGEEQAGETVDEVEAIDWDTEDAKYEPASTWYFIRPVLPPPPLPPLKSILAHPQFPHLRFVRACWDSDSMMNRKRLWGMVKQFDGLWKEYRTNGWDVDRFFPSEEILDVLYEDENGCRPVCER